MSDVVSDVALAVATVLGEVISNHQPESRPRRRIVLDRPRDLPGYDGRGASTALLLAAKRCVSCADVYRPLRLDEMALEQIEREQARERVANA